MKPNQAPKVANQVVVSGDPSEPEYWQKLFNERLEKFKDLIDMAEQVGEVEPFFKGIRGFFKLQNVKRKTAGLKTSIKAVKAIDIVLERRGLRLN